MLTSQPSLFSDKKKKKQDLIVFLLLQGYCSFKSFWLLSSECPCAPLMGLIWYSALMPSLIFVCETKCFDGGWLLERLCLPKASLSLFFYLFCIYFLPVESECYGPSPYSTLCAFCSKQEHRRLNFGFASSSPPSSQQLCCRRVCVMRVCRKEIEMRVFKVNYCKRLPINLLSWKCEWYCTRS